MKPNSTHLQSPDAWLVGPDWRWQRAIRLATSTTPASIQPEDPHVQAAVRYLRLQARGAAAKHIADVKFPAVAAAQRLWMDAALRSQLMILAVANTPQDDMAQHLDVDPAVVALAELLFFDVREALGATVWIHTTVVLRLAKDGDIDLAAKVKTAFFGGPVVAKALCDGQIKVPKDAADRLVAQELLLHAKFTAAIEFPLTNDQSFEFLKLFMDYKLQRDKLEQHRQAFAHRCQEAVRRYELRKQQLALAAISQGLDLSTHSPTMVDTRAEHPAAPASRQGPRRRSQPDVKAAG